MSIPAITPLTDLPSIADPANFDPRADNFITVQLPRLVSEINTAGEAMEQAVEDAQAAAAVAINGTSSTSIALSTGSKNFTVLAGHSWSAGTWLMIASRANPSTHWMIAQVASYSGTLLNVSVHSFGGSGSRADWDLSITAKPADIPIATTSANGLMSAADKVKLNGVAEGAQVNTVTSVAGRAGAVVLVKTDVALGNVDNVKQLPAAGGTHSGGFTSLSSAAHTLSGTSITPSATNGHTQRLTASTSAWTLNAPTGTTTDYDLEILVTNPTGGSGVMTPSGFNYANTTAFKLTANAVFKFMISVRGARKTLRVAADS